jgi:hypothetical protein
MRIVITKSTTVSGRCVSDGDTVDASESDALILIGLGKAEKWDAEKHAAKAARKA